MGEGRESDLYLARGRDTQQGCVSELAGEVSVCVSVLGKGVCAPGTCEEGCCPMGGCVQEAAGEEEEQQQSSSCPAFSLSLQAQNRLS